ncbi:MAG: flagellar basal body-associated protein FliL [Bosea sp. (in: a-proteobacteria)]
MAKKPKKTDAETEGAEGAAPAEGGKSKKKLIMMAGGGLVALSLLGGGGWFFFLKGKGDTDKAATADAKAAAKKTGFVEMREMLINMSTPAQAERQSFVKIRVALEIADAKQAPEIQPLLPRIEDTFQVYLRELRAADLEGSAGLFRLKEELLRRVNVAVYPAKVDAVLFKELLVQ